MDFIYLSDYKKHPDAKINAALLWEYDLSDFDYQQMRNVVVQRVIERGWPNDWWAALNLYGEKGMKDAIKAIPYLNDKDMNFVSKAFEIPFIKNEMLQKETVTAGTLELLTSLMQDNQFIDFFLVGGTALSLQIGHGISIDIALFSRSPFDENKMLVYLESKKVLQLDYLDKNTIKGQISETKVDLITHSYPLVKELIIYENIRIASLEDIAAMKLNAIVGNGTRLKDFIDVAYLSCYLSLKTMMNACEAKYATRNPILTIKALSYHQDINFNEPIQMLACAYSWKPIEKRLHEMEKFQTRIFETPPLFSRK